MAVTKQSIGFLRGMLTFSGKLFHHMITLGLDAGHFVENVICQKCCNFKNIHRKILRFIL